MENKKSFILYSDLIHTVNKIPDETAGKLLKHILAYVNDLNPETDDLLVEVAFEPIKQAMKRDLKKWETQIDRKSQGAILGNLKRWHSDLYEKVQANDITLDEAQSIAKHRIPSHSDKTDGIAIKSIASIAVSDSVSVSVNDNVNVINNNNTDKPIFFNFKNELIKLGINEQTASDYISQRNKKRASNTETALNILKKEIAKSGKTAQDCIEVAIERGWIGYKHEWDKTQTTSQAQKVAAHVLVKTNKNIEDGWS